MYLLCNWNMSDAAGMDDFGEFEPRNLSYFLFRQVETYENYYIVNISPER